MPVVSYPYRVNYLECDKHLCGERLYALPNTGHYGPEFDKLFKDSGWSRWVNLGERVYCPDHGPSKNSKLRRVQ